MLTFPRVTTFLRIDAMDDNIMMVMNLQNFQRPLTPLIFFCLREFAELDVIQELSRDLSSHPLLALSHMWQNTFKKPR